MTLTEALITTARHYCIDNYAYWADKYQREAKPYQGAYSDHDYNLFPRYKVLAAIRQEVETLVGQSFDSFDNCKEELKRIGLAGQDLSATMAANPIAHNAIEEERNKFVVFIDSITTSYLHLVEPLPYRRKLKAEEAKLIRQQLIDTWNFDGTDWEPLNNKSPQPTVFVMNKYITELDTEKIIQVLAEKAGNKIFEIDEDQIDYEIEIDSFELNLYETACCDETLEWIIYGSHESTTAFGGSWLIELVQELFSDRLDKLNKWE